MGEAESGTRPTADWTCKQRYCAIENITRTTTMLRRDACAEAVMCCCCADHLLPVQQAVGEHLAGADSDRHGWATGGACKARWRDSQMQGHNR